MAKLTREEQEEATWRPCPNCGAEAAPEDVRKCVRCGAIGCPMFHCIPEQLCYAHDFDDEYERDFVWSDLHYDGSGLDDEYYDTMDDAYDRSYDDD